MTGAELTHGWPGLLTAFATVQAPMLAAMARSRAQLHRYLIAPAVAAPLTVMTGLGMSLINPLLQSVGVGAHSSLQWIVGASLGAWLGYVGGGVVARTPTQDAEYRRGTVIDEDSRHSPRGLDPAAERYAEHGAALASSRRAGRAALSAASARDARLTANQARGSRGAGGGRGQAFQNHRHHGHRQEYGDRRDLERCLGARRSSRDCRSGRWISAAVLFGEPRRRDPEPV